MGAELGLVQASESSAARAIADLAEEIGADLVVVGNRGHGPVAAIFLGNFTFRLLQTRRHPGPGRGGPGLA